MTPLLESREVDRMLRYPRGRSLKLAKAGQLPHVTLPDGEVRFPQDELEKFLLSREGAARSYDGEVCRG